MNAIKQQKQTYREHARLHRDRLDIDQTDFEAIIDVFFKNFTPAKDQIIALYWPIGKEFDCRFLMDELVNQGYQCALPYMTKNERVFQFAKWDHDTKMHDGVLGIPEPESPTPIQPDVVLSPLLAFDQKGYRLGQGGGHYDATISALRALKEVQYIGIGYAEQAVLLKLPREAHDIPLDYMLTPQDVIRFER